MISMRRLLKKKNLARYETISGITMIGEPEFPGITLDQEGGRI